MSQKISLYGFQVINHLKMDPFLKHIIHIQFVQKSVLTNFMDNILNIKFREDIQILKCFNSILLSLNWEILFLVYQKRKVLLLV